MAAAARGTIAGGADIIGGSGPKPEVGELAGTRGGIAATGAREATAGMLQGGGGGPRVSSIGRRVGRLCDEGPATCAKVESENSPASSWYVERSGSTNAL
jgi:hypothetical protein